MSDENIHAEERELKTPRLLIVLAAVTALMLVCSVWMIFYYAPVERVMGFVQKIFYFHVPSAWMSFLAVFVMAIGSIGYLVQRTDKWDRIGDAGVELAIVFGVMVLISGPLWGRKAWGVYWVWDVRLTSTLVLVLTLVACKIVRAYAGPGAKQIAAGLAVFAVLNTIFVYYSIDIWRGTHPPKVVDRKTLDPAMYSTLWFCALTYLLAFISLLWSRIRMGKLRTALDHLHMQATEADIP